MREINLTLSKLKNNKNMIIQELKKIKKNLQANNINIDFIDDKINEIKILINANSDLIVQNAKDILNLKNELDSIDFDIDFSDIEEKINNNSALIEGNQNQIQILRNIINDLKESADLEEVLEKIEANKNNIDKLNNYMGYLQTLQNEIDILKENVDKIEIPEDIDFQALIQEIRENRQAMEETKGSIEELQQTKADTGEAKEIRNKIKELDYKIALLNGEVVSPPSYDDEEEEGYKIMTAVIDLNNSDPTTCIKYEESSLGLIKGSDDWDNFFGEYPCILKGGEEIIKLNPNNFNEDVNGNEVDITSGELGDVMICFPRRGLKLYNLNNKIYVKITDNPHAEKEGFTYLAFQRGKEEKERFYISAYKGYVDEENKLRSLANKDIKLGQTIEVCREQAHNNGEGYEIRTWYQIIYMQCMYILKYKNLNSQQVLGIGVYGGAVAKTGGSELYGMDSSNYTNPTNINTKHMKLFGIEDFWGNNEEWIDGAKTDASYNLLVANTDFNNEGEGYKLTANIPYFSGNYLKNAMGTTEAGFLPANNQAANNLTYFCDYIYYYTDKFLYYGSYASYSWQNGIFMMAFETTRPYGTTTARLSYY